MVSYTPVWRRSDERDVDDDFGSPALPVEPFSPWCDWCRGCAWCSVRCVLSRVFGALCSVRGVLCDVFCDTGAHLAELPVLINVSQSDGSHEGVMGDGVVAE